jgi:hypothetical protein
VTRRWSTGLSTRYVMKFVGVYVVALLLVVAGLLAWIVRADSVASEKRAAYRAAYYEQHPLLKSLHDAAMRPDGVRENYGSRPRGVLLTRVPLGTPADDVIAILAEHDLECRRSPSSGLRQISCGVSQTAREHHVPSWRIHLTPDHSGRLAHADVWIGK